MICDSGVLGRAPDAAGLFHWRRNVSSHGTSGIETESNELRQDGGSAILRKCPPGAGVLAGRQDFLQKRSLMSCARMAVLQYSASVHRAHVCWGNGRNSGKQIGDPLFFGDFIGK